MIDFTTNSPNILASTRLSRMVQTAHLIFVTSTIREEESMKVEEAEVVDVDLLEEEVNDVSV